MAAQLPLFNPPVPVHKPKIKLTLSNRFATFNISPETQIELKKYFRYRKPGYEFTSSYIDDPENGGYQNLFLRSRVATGLFLEKRSELEKHYCLVVEDIRQAPRFRK